MAISGASEKIKVLKEIAYGDGGLAGEKVFGVTKKFEWKAEASTQQSYGLETDGPQATVNTDLVINVSGTHEWDLTSGQEFEAIMGSTGTSAGGKFSVTVTKTLPSYSVQAVDSSGSFVIIKGIKYSKFALKMARGTDPVGIVAEWIGKTVENTSSFTPTVTSVEPLMYLDGYFQLGTTKQTELDTINLVIDRKVQGRRFIENTAANSRRLISTIIEGPLTLTYDGTMAAQRAVLNEILGGSSMTDVRTDKNVILNITRGTTFGLKLTMTGGRHTTTGRVLDKSQEISMMDFAGIGINISGTGTYSP